MARIRLKPQLMFRLLCGAIGLLAAVLLAMVVVMLYPLVVSGGNEPEDLSTPMPQHVTPTRQANMQSVCGAWHDRFWPELKKEEPKEEIQTLEEFGEYIFTGSIHMSSGAAWGIFQRKKGDQFKLSVGEKQQGVELLDVVKGIATVRIDNRTTVRLKKVNPASGSTGRGSRGKQPARNDRSGRVSSNSRTQVRGSGSSGSARLAQGSNTQTVRATVVKEGVTVTSGTSRQVTAGGGSRVSTARGRQSTNWRQYWAERMKKRRELEEARKQQQ